jgi:hypothetical protein
MSRPLSFGPLYRALDAYDKVEGTFDSSDEKSPATRAWRWVERASLVTAMGASAAMLRAGMIDDNGRLTPKGTELLIVRPDLTLEQISKTPST